MRCGDTDDVFYDATGRRVYVTGGEGCATVLEQSGANAYKAIGTVTTAPGARTSLFVPSKATLYVAVPRRAGQRAEVRSFTAEGTR